MYTRNLISEQYGVLASSKPCTFIVVKPAGEVYEVNPARKSCTCKAGQSGKPCCHLSQLRDLLRYETRRMLALAADTPMFSHELQLVAEVEMLVSKWNEVKSNLPH